MRLWHKDLIPFLPRQQLLGQWRECCLIARQIATNGAPNHILVDQIMDYPIDHFVRYGIMVSDEMFDRGYTVNKDAFLKYLYPNFLIEQPLFEGWHDDIYLRECLYNLEEKYRASGITYDEWMIIYNRCHDFTPLIF